jgi:hypothetical protein
MSDVWLFLNAVLCMPWHGSFSMVAVYAIKNQLQLKYMFKGFGHMPGSEALGLCF